MSLAQRQALVTKLQDIKTRGTKEGDPDIVFLRQVIARIDEELLRRGKGLSLADSIIEHAQGAKVNQERGTGMAETIPLYCPICSYRNLFSRPVEIRSRLHANLPPGEMGEIGIACPWCLFSDRGEVIFLVEGQGGNQNGGTHGKQNHRKSDR